MVGSRLMGEVGAYSLALQTLFKFGPKKLKISVDAYLFRDFRAMYISKKKKLLTRYSYVNFKRSFAIEYLYKSYFINILQNIYIIYMGKKVNINKCYNTMWQCWTPYTIFFLAYNMHICEEIKRIKK